MRGVGLRVFLRALVLMLTVLAACVACSDSEDTKDQPPKQDPPPSGVEVIRPIKLTEEARIPENDPALDHVEIALDRLIFHYKAKPTIALAPGHVVAGMQDRGYLRRLTSVAFKDSSTLEASTEAAYITDFILDGAFKVRTKPSPQDWVEGTASTAQALEQGLQVFSPMTKNGFACGNAYGQSLEIDPVFDIDFDFELELDIEAQLWPPKGKIAHALFLATGGIEAGFEATAVSSLSLTCSIDLVQALRKFLKNENALKWELTPIKFAIGVVPVVVTHSIEPTAAVQAAVELAFAAKLHATTGYQLTMGAEFKDGQWLGIWQPQRTGTVEATVPDEDGNLSLSASLSAGVFYKAFLYDLAGPKLGLEGSIEGTLEGDPQKCTWNTQVEAGVNLVVGAELQIPLADWTLADYSQSFELAKKKLSEATGTYGDCSEAGTDAGADASVDAEVDASSDADTDATPEAGADAATGTPCTTASECQSGFCVDGVCCNEICNSQCRACVASKSKAADGICAAMKDDTDPDNECPNQQTCQGTTTYTAYCKAHIGDPCTDQAGSTDCPGAGFCRDGVCCNQANCTVLTTCFACSAKTKGQGLDGYCGPIVAGQDPLNECTNGVCNGSGGCM